MSWSRAARTDKGVSAVGNVVSVKLKLDQVDPSNTESHRNRGMLIL